MTELDADRALALTYVPYRRREAVRALWRLDVALGAVLAGGREPLISRIKLAWWRDSLADLDRARAPAEPVLQDVARHILPADVTGERLSAMEEGWSVLLSEEPLSAADLSTYAGGRGALLFRFAAELLGEGATPMVEKAGEGWALMDLARHSNEVDAGRALEAARERFVGLPEHKWPPLLRPIGMLAALARRDAERGLEAMEPPGAPARMLLMLRHRLTGR